MKYQRRQLLRALGAAPAAALAAPWTAALAQGDYPAKPIRLVVPFPAGSTPDVFARTVGDKAAQGLKQPIVIEQQSALDDGLVREWRPPDTGVNTHYAYALQWFAMALAIAVIYLVTHVRRAA